MAKATWKGAVLAESETFEVVEGNVYFPRSSLKMDHFRASATQTTCGWKGIATYFDVVVGGTVNSDAAWTYEAPKEAAKNITSFVAFWRGVEVTQ